MYIVKEGDNLLSIARKELGCHTKYCLLYTSDAADE